MTKQMSLEKLGRRAVACKHWRWMDGMAANELPGYRVVSNNCEGRAYLTDGDDSQSVKDCSPDLSDPATLGCLLALVREAWRAPHAAPQWDQRWQHWAVLAPNYDQECESWKNLGADDTEAEALVVALEMAP